jgi:hypothetical protein
MKKLGEIAREIDSSGTHGACLNIEEYSEDVERSLIQAFDIAYRRGDKVEMSVYAKTLFDFNGGQSCIPIYINQHPFLLHHIPSPIQMDAPSLPGNTIEDIHKADAGLIKLFEDIKNVVSKEWPLISAVFPNPSYVMQTFVQKIFAQSVSIIF